MPYLHDPRRTVTLNLHPDAYAALVEDTLQAGYATPGAYVKALVQHRGDAPDPILDQRSEERVARLEGGLAYLQQQFESARHQLKQAGIAFSLSKAPLGQERPRSRAAQDRAIQRAVKQAVEAAVAEALQQERAAQRALRAARKAAREVAAPVAPTLAVPPPAPAVTAAVIPAGRRSTKPGK